MSEAIAALFVAALGAFGIWLIAKFTNDRKRWPFTFVVAAFVVAAFCLSGLVSILVLWALP